MSVMNYGWKLPKRKEMIFSRQRCSKGSIKNGRTTSRARIEESGGSSSALKEYLGTHVTLVDPVADTYSCTYPDTQTQEYCVDHHTAHPSSVVPATQSASAQPSPNAQGSTSTQPSSDAHGSTSIAQHSPQDI
ncbi:uncharacterized protein A4U43_C01F23760 [Asparagus officinalis]|uniref:Uncharacterized protein n=1 Tax=Asparagus officinalis TaxID=4686 RepID=A0A5P1FTG1_ASPOF|nr:uncharacterized protein A4U43_C01F23760 [Asparagus officinalis]